jgi:hypothetical protein
LLAEDGYTEDEMEVMVCDLREKGLIRFLESYLKPEEDGKERSLRRLLLGFGIVPVCVKHQAQQDSIITLGFTVPRGLTPIVHATPLAHSQHISGTR